MEVELKDLFTRYSTDVIATCAFGVKVDSYKEKDNEFFTNGKQSIGFAKMTMPKMLMLSFPLLVKVCNKLNKLSSQWLFEAVNLENKSFPLCLHIILSSYTNVLVKLKPHYFQNKSI